ncbi:MAG: hypothetical protein R3A50_04735 [Saprospiraceae bacterium]
MKRKKKPNKVDQKPLDNQEVFELLNEANSQYENYLRLRALDYDENLDNQINVLKRDINFPLNIVLK